MAWKVEEMLSRSLRPILADLPNGAEIVDSEPFREVMSSLEFFITFALAEIYPEWNRECLDGVLSLVAHKTGEAEAEILGLGFLESDHALTPLHLRLQLDPSHDEVSWFECSLGERGHHGMVRTPYGSLKAVKRLYALDARADLIDWVYKVSFGRRRP